MTDPTAVVTISPDATIADAASLMQREHVSALVVVEGDQPLVGLLTERDLLQVIIDGDDPSDVAVRRRMTTDVITITPATDTMEARELMGRHAVRHLPVIDGGVVVGLVEQTEPRVGLHFGGRRNMPDGREPTTVIEDFRGPYRDGPPEADLRVESPALDRFGFTEVRRGVTIGVVLIWGIVRSLLRRRFDLVFRRRAVGSWWDAACAGAVDAFEKLGPAFVKLGQIMASSPGVFPEPLADACQRTLDEVPPFDSATARQVIEEDLGHPPEALFRFFDDKPLASASIGQVHACV